MLPPCTNPWFLKQNVSPANRDIIFLIMQLLAENNLTSVVPLQDRAKAEEILMKDLKCFSSVYEELFKELALLLCLNNSRDIFSYSDALIARGNLLIELRLVIAVNPLLKDKLQIPVINPSRLRTLINQSLNWQHSLCANPCMNPEMKMLLEDHSCSNPNDQFAANIQLYGCMPPNTDGFLPMSTTNTVCVIKEPAQWQSLKISTEVAKHKVTRLTYTNSGTGILSLTLALNGVHLYWGWTQTANGKATTKAKHDLQQPAGIDIMMTNDIVHDSITDEGISRFTLSKDDHSLMSASGGGVSLFDTRTFKMKEIYEHETNTFNSSKHVPNFGFTFRYCFTSSRL